MAVVFVHGIDPSVISFMDVLGFVSRFRLRSCYLLKLCNFVALVMKFANSVFTGVGKKGSETREMQFITVLSMERS